MKKSVVCVLLAWMVLLGGCSTQPLGSKGDFGHILYNKRRYESR